MAVTHQNIPSITHINAIREIGNILAADSSQELPLIREHDYTVTLEVADVELVTANSQIGWLAHVLAAIKPVQEVSCFGYDEYCWGNAVYGDNGASIGDGQSGHDVYVADGNLLQKVTGLSEDLHSGSLAAPVANDKLTRAFDYGNLQKETVESDKDSLDKAGIYKGCIKPESIQCFISYFVRNFAEIKVINILKIKIFYE